VAGGRARRFAGQDKSRLVIEGRTIIVRQVEVLQRVAGEVFVVGPEPGRYEDLGLATYPDTIAGAGALGGIDAALTAARHDAVIVVACDLPFLDADLLRRLVDLSANRDGAWVRSARGVEPLIACYRRQAQPRIRARLEAGRFKAADLATVLDVAEVGPDDLARFGPPDRLLANINTPDDYARVQYGSS
jgi:molybdenum cofactor guanylyltransferase